MVGNPNWHRSRQLYKAICKAIAAVTSRAGHFECESGREGKRPKPGKLLQTPKKRNPRGLRASPGTASALRRRTCLRGTGTPAAPSPLALRPTASQCCGCHAGRSERPVRPGAEKARARCPGLRGCPPGCGAAAAASWPLRAAERTCHPKNRAQEQHTRHEATGRGNDTTGCARRGHERAQSCQQYRCSGCRSHARVKPLPGRLLHGALAARNFNRVGLVRVHADASRQRGALQTVAVPQSRAPVAVFVHDAGRRSAALEAAELKGVEQGAEG